MTDTAIARPSGTSPFIAIPDDIRAFLGTTRFATIGTIDPAGGPRQAVVWYTIEGDEIVLNSAVGRRWPTNLVRDSRIAFSVVDETDGYLWIGLTGLVSVVDDQPTAQADIAAMARRYHADDPDKAERIIHRQFERQTRISFRMRLLSASRHFD